MNEYIKRTVTSAVTFVAVFTLFRGCNSAIQRAPDYERPENESAVEYELSSNYPAKIQNVAASVADAQRRLDELVDFHVYDRHFAQNDEKEMQRYFSCLEEWLDVKLENPLAPNETVKNFAELHTITWSTQKGQAQTLHRYIHNHHVYFSGSRKLPGDTIQLFQDTLTGIKSVYAIHLQKVKDRFQLRKEKMVGLFGDCFSLSCLYVACLRGLGIKDSYICTVTIDQKGLNYLEKMANKMGIGHACAVVKIDGHFVIVDVLAPEGYDYPYQKIRVLNDIEVMTEYFRGVRKIKDMPFQLRKLVEIHPFEYETRLHVSDNSIGKEALDNARMAVTLDRNYLTLTTLAQEYLANKDYKRAERYILESLAMHPRYNVAHGLHAKILYDTGRFGEALKAVETALVYRKHFPLFVNLKKAVKNKLDWRSVKEEEPDPLENVVLFLYAGAALLLTVLIMVFRVHRVHRPRIFKYRLLPALWNQ